MPCTKCKEGKYKWGKTGECEYATKEACESANHKYKMHPTPLGKTYEEYAKELKEFNLASQRFDFNDMKTLAKLAKEADKLDSIFRKLLKKVDDSYFALLDQQEETLKGKEEYDTSLDNITAIKKQNEKRLEDGAKKSEKAYKAYSNSAKKVETLKGKNDKDEEEILTEKNKIKSFLNNFGGAIEDVEQAGKALGVDVPVDKFYTIYNKLDALQLRYS